MPVSTSSSSARCAPASSESAGEAPFCFVDGYEALVAVGDPAPLFPDQEDVVRRFRSAPAPAPPVEQIDDQAAFFVFPTGRGTVYLVWCHRALAERYRPLAWTLYEELRRAW